MSPRFRRIGFFLLRLLVLAVLVEILLRTVDLGAAGSLLLSLPGWMVFAALLLFGAGQVLSTYRWRLVLQEIHGDPPPLLSLLRLYLIGMFVNLGLPTMAGGDVARAELLRRRAGSGGGVYASVLADRLIGLTAVILLAFIASMLAGNALGEEIGGPVRLVSGVGLAGLALFAVALRTDLRFPLPRPLRLLVDALGLLARRPGVLGQSLTIAIIVQSVAVVLPIALLARGLGIELPFLVHAALVPVIVLITQVPIAPNGIGLRETAFVVLYAPFGIAPEALLALGAAWSLVLTFYGLAGGVVLAAYQRGTDSLPDLGPVFRR